MTLQQDRRQNWQSPWLLLAAAACFAFLLVVLPRLSDATGPGYRVDPTKRFAWGENVGWIDFGSVTGSGEVVVDEPMLRGFAWGENVGWISLNCNDTDQCSSLSYGVQNQNGILSGYAWGENVGWIDFAPAQGGVTIDSHGDFHGAAWGENIGWVFFDCDATSSCNDLVYRVSAGWYPRESSSSSTSAKERYVSPDFIKGNMHVTNMIEGKEKQGTLPASASSSTSSASFTPIFPAGGTDTMDPSAHPSKHVFLNRSYTRAKLAKETVHPAATVEVDPAVLAMRTLLQNLIEPLLPNHRADDATLRTLDDMHGIFVTVIAHEAARHDGLRPAFPSTLPDAPSRASIGALLVRQFGLPVPPQLSLIHDPLLRDSLAAASYGIIDADAVATPATDHATFSEFALMIQHTEEALIAQRGGQQL